MPDQIKQPDKEKVERLIGLNPDSKSYFFAKADENWLGWLWKNGFLDKIKAKSEDGVAGSYRRMPELDYLVRIAEKFPDKVVDIILEVPIVADTLNPEVVDRFIWICSHLPDNQLSRVVSKIRDEKWVPLAGQFNRWDFEYEDMIKTLVEAKNYSSLLILAEAVLTVRPKEELTEKNNAVFARDNPFYLNNDLRQTKIFQALASVDDLRIEDSFKLASRVIDQIVKLGDKKEGGEFTIIDKFYLFDVDFFTLDFSPEDDIHYRVDIRDLVVAIKKLAERIMSLYYDDPVLVRLFYETYIGILPDSQSMWRLRLFMLSLSPDIFKEELKNIFLKIFNYQDPWGFIDCPEYMRALKKSFSAIKQEDQRSYVKQAIEYFGAEEKDKLFRHSGKRIFSSIYESLENGEKEKIQSIFGKLDPGFEPEPAMKIGGVGWIKSRAPIDGKGLSQLSVSEIVKNLKNQWSPTSLREQDKERDSYNPIDAEGVSDALKTNLKIRLNEYLPCSVLFFERDNLDPHYTYSFLIGIREAIREKKYLLDTDWSGVLKLCKEIINSNDQNKFESGTRQRKDGTWLAGWGAVNNAMADVVEELLKGEGEKTVVDFVYNRDELFLIITYLLTYPDPIFEGEKSEESFDLQNKIQYTGNDPFTAAMNSVRGKAFQSLALFVYREGLNFPEEAASKIKPDVKDLYENCLNGEKTQAILFLFGHYLPSYFYRDKDWIRGLLPLIFQSDPDKKDLYLAAWEGYLSTNLYKELFDELVGFYERAINLDSDSYTKRRYFQDIDEALATHIALAYIHFPDFGFESNLFRLFWERDNLKRHGGFISFVGRHVISRDQAKDWIKVNNIEVEKLKNLWEWVLRNCNEKEALAEFGFWINTEGDVFELTWLASHIRQTLEKSGGALSWERGMMKSLPTLAREQPSDSLEIIRLYFKYKADPANANRGWLYIDSGTTDIFKILYENSETKKATYQLINQLLPLSNGQFWRLKEVLKED